MLKHFSIVVFTFLFGTAAAQTNCGVNQGKLTVSVKFDGSPGQTSVQLLDVTSNNSPTNLPIAQLANTLVDYETCVARNRVYKVTARDSGGNGISGGGYVSVSVNDRLIASVGDFGSEASWFFFADGQDCPSGQSRFVFNIKYDNDVAGTQFTLLRNSNNNALVSNESLQVTDALANGYLNLDKCVAIGQAHTFNINKSNGLPTGFYRAFNEYTLIASSGGPQGFKGSQQTQFTPTIIPVGGAPTPAGMPSGPTPTGPTPSSPAACDDNQFGTFLDNTGKAQPCIWLNDKSRRDTAIPTYCPTSSPSGARFICPETCGVCSDTCNDDDSVSFSVDGQSGRNCVWVRVRIQANDAYWRPRLCVPNSVAGPGAWTNCKETCENCSR
jgi:hypothetical protein